MEVNWNAIEAYFTFYSRDTISVILSYLYFLLLLVTAVGAIIIFSNQRGEHKWRFFGRLVFWEYLAFILCITVFFRECVEERAINMTPFWSYMAESEDIQHSLYVECLMNVLMFVPFGLLIGSAFKRVGCKKMFLACLSLSIMIELLQFIFKRGLCETDDVIHNVLGAAIGFGIYCIFAWIWSKVVGERE